jgi:hypothetical protein
LNESDRPPHTAIDYAHTLRDLSDVHFPDAAKITLVQDNLGKRVNLRGAPSSAIIRTSEHFHVFSPPPRLSVRMFGSGGKKRANA